ncbi:MAG: SUMF1/EgtB/PvdO family nonheme iron enzyme [Chitinispirillaceae bacterium]|nr:SUMF1/EgtB/PvdO family nonheme iron enzyme [Chitinispirillaceae bacterium]
MKKTAFLITFLAFSLPGADPEILNWSVVTDSFTIASKSVRIDTIRGDSTQPDRTDTVTGITWNGSLSFSCRDSDGDSMGVFIDVLIGADTIAADTVWSAATVVTGDHYRAYFAFRSVHKAWTRETEAKVRLSLDDVYRNYQGRPKITSQPENVSTLMGNQARFAVTATGTPAPSYQWLFNGAPIPGADRAEFVIEEVDSGDAGSYSVLVSNPIGKVMSQTVTLRVNYTPIITLQPVSDTIDVGSSVTFSVEGTGYPKPAYQWRKNGDSIPGATSASYTIPAVSRADSGSYTVVLSNVIGNRTSSPALLTVNYPPVITVQPRTATARIGQSALFGVTVSARPAPVYQWRENAAVLSGKTHGNMGILSVTADDTGSYSVVVTNRLGSVTSDTVPLRIDLSVLVPDSMIAIAGGTFLMGKLFLSDPVHEVTLTAFKMSNTLVTQREYLRVMEINPSHITDDPLCPVEYVTWFDAVLYCNRRSILEAKDTVYAYSSIVGTPGNGVSDLGDIAANFSKNGYRLPTEAEWEYACRAGTSTDYYWGGSYPPMTIEDTTEISCHAVYYYNSGERTKPVGTKPANPWGLYDIVGQLWQWHNDWFGPYTAGLQTDPAGPETGFSRTVRGGSWSIDDDDRHLRSMARNGGYHPEDRSWIIGFRVVCR